MTGTRTVVEPYANFDLAAHSNTATIQSVVALTTNPSNPQTLLFYIGTQSGTLILLSSAQSPPNLSFIRSVSVTDKPVDAVIVVGELGIVVLLSDGALWLVDLMLGGNVKRVGGFKGVSLVCHRFWSGDGGNGLLESESLSAGGEVVRQDGGGSSGDGNGLSEFESASAGSRFFKKFGRGVRLKEREGIRRGGGSGSMFAFVVGRKLVLVELGVGGSWSSGDVDIKNASFVVLKEIQIVEGVKTMVWIDDCIFVGTVNGYSIVSCVTGQSGVIFTLPDGGSSPKLRLLPKEKKVLLMMDSVGVMVDAHGQPVGGSLVFHGVPDSVGETSSYVVVVRSGKMELYHKRSGSCSQVVSFGGEGVGQCVIADGDDGNGKIVAVATPSKVLCYRKVPSEEQVKDLLKKKNFKEALSLVEELEFEGEISKEMLSFVHAQIGFLLFFDLQFEEAVNHFLQSETMQLSEVFPFIMRDPNRWSLLVPRNRYWGLHPPAVPFEDVVDEGLVAIQRAIFLRKAGVETEVDEKFISSPPSRAALLESAIKNITRYLEVSREKELDLAVKEGVDTLLMYLYRALDRVEDMEKLASSTNSCFVEELETLLDESGHLRTLAFLYASKGMTSKALEIWRVLARNYSSGLWKDPTVENAPLNTNFISSKEIAAFEGSKILEESSDQNLVLQHLGWIADINELLVVQVLTSDRRATPLSPDDVIAAIDSKRVEILQRYLQWLIEDQESNDIQIHTLYALSLAKSAIETFDEDRTALCNDTGTVQVVKTSGLGKTAIFQSPVRERLQNFLQSSELYDPEEVLDLIEESELWLEKATLYRKLGQETLVLQILAWKLEDCKAAEQYCAEIGRPEAYMQLLDMYLYPQNGKEPMYKAAVRLLHNHGVSLDPLQVLETLSPDMPLQLASETILKMLRARLHHHLQGQIMHSLYRAIDIDARLARLEERSRNVQINDESLCDSCHARLGTKLFAMYPDDTVVCYKCFRRQGESTSVAGRDFRQDALVKPGWLTSQ